MLDTDTCSYIIKENPKKPMDSFIAHQHDDICISSITRAELLYGAKKKASEKITKKVEEFLKMLPIISFDIEAADVYSDIRNELEKAGTPIGEMDMLIAACAISSTSVLITNNQKHFGYIKNLNLENWC